VRFGVRTQIVLLLTFALTLVFASVFFWVDTSTTERTMNGLRADLDHTLLGAVKLVDADESRPRGNLSAMPRQIVWFESHDAATRADTKYWAGKTMDERLAAVETLRDQYFELRDEAPARLQRVLAFTPLAPGES
jgi:hypothetical protein